MDKKPLALIIMDGYGLDAPTETNAIYMAKTPNLDRYFSENPYTTIGASGMDVGLPDGQMGNSEVGHTNIGAGRIVYQELTRISKMISTGEFFKNTVLKAAMDNAKKGGRTLHIMGLVSDGGVHSHNTHLYGLLEMARREGVKDVAVHCFTDGRDVSPTSGVGFIAELLEQIKEKGVGRIASIMGRYYAMDRDTRWERVVKAYDAIVNAQGPAASDPVKAVEESYAAGVTDEFIVPVVIGGGAKVKDGDSVIFFNFRPDRARELTRAFVDPGFSGFERRLLQNLCFVCMTQYDATMPNVSVAYLPQSLENTFGEYISKLGLKQLRIAETTKYAHVTFFFNGGIEKVYPGEDRVLIPTPNVATFDLKPEMSAYGIAEEAVRRINSGVYDVIILNFANCDMVGHTGVFDAAKAAVEAVDECVKTVVDAVLQKGGIPIITADHGNAEKMVDDDGSPYTAHTTNPVPFAIVGYPCKLRQSGGRLADIAPTMLDILGLEKPAEMDGEGLIER